MKILKRINKVFIVFIIVFLLSFGLFIITNDAFKEFEFYNFFQNLSSKIIGIFGILIIFFIAFLLSNNKKRISFRVVFYGISFQLFLAFLIMKIEYSKSFVNKVSNIIIKILSFSEEGSRFLFGNLIYKNIPLEISSVSLNSSYFGCFVKTGAVFAFSVLPSIVFFSALMSILYHIKFMELIIKIISFAMQKTMQISGAESFSTAANIFIGQTEAPLLIKPFLSFMTKSELMTVMSGGFATVAGGVLAAYVGMLVGYFPDITVHLLTASVLSAPASVVMAKIIFPETQIPKTFNTTNIIIKKKTINIFDAASKGATDGLSLALNVGAMLIAFIGIIAFMNWIVCGAGLLLGISNLSLTNIFSILFSPVAYMMGVPLEDSFVIGGLLGTKVIVNELVAYMQLAHAIEGGLIKNSNSIIITTYALCGFANFSSIGVQIGGLSVLAPKRRSDFAKIAFKAMIAGTLACFQTAAIAGLLI